MEPVLQIKGVSISFTQYSGGLRQRTLPVIRDLSLTVRPGQVVAVVGASGSGKSLLAHGILGLLPYNSRMEGKILYEGAPLTAKRAAKLRGKEIALVPQGVTYLDPLMKVGAQLCRGRRDAETKARYRAALQRYGLGPETEELYRFELSGGMARRVLIASAGAEQTRLIIADEPTPGLDARAAARVSSGISKELAEEGAGVLLITHDLELALTIADRCDGVLRRETMEEAAAAAVSRPRAAAAPVHPRAVECRAGQRLPPLMGSQPYRAR